MLTRLMCVMATMAAFCAAQPAAAAVVAYTDVASWTAAVSGFGPTSTESFNGAPSSFAANSTGNVIGLQTTVDLIGGVTDTGPTGLTGNGYFQGEVDSNGRDALSLNFNFASGIGGFALNDFRNDSATNPRGLQLQEIGIVIDGQSYLVSDLLGRTNSATTSNVSGTASTGSFFLGFVSDTNLTGFSLIHGDLVSPGFTVSGNNEEFYIGSMTLAAPAPSTVPVPAALPLLLAGLGAFVALGWRRRATAG